MDCWSRRSTAGEPLGPGHHCVAADRAAEHVMPAGDAVLHGVLGQGAVALVAPWTARGCHGHRGEVLDGIGPRRDQCPESLDGAQVGQSLHPGDGGGGRRACLPADLTVGCTRIGLQCAKDAAVQVVEHTLGTPSRT